MGWVVGCGVDIWSVRAGAPNPVSADVPFGIDDCGAFLIHLSKIPGIFLVKINFPVKLMFFLDFLIYNDSISPVTTLYINFVCARCANPSGSWGRQIH
jgi:hypothetical protein